MEDINSFDQTLKHMLIYLTQVQDTLILFGVTDDTVLRDHVIEVLRERLPEAITLRHFRYDREHISLLEGVVETAASSNGRVVVSVTGLEALPRDKQSEAIKLLNYQRNRFGRTGLAVIVWVNQALFAEIANKAADFYSWRSHTFFIEPPPDWDKLESLRRSYLQALFYQNEYVNLQGLAPVRGGQIVQMRMDHIFIPLRAEQEVSSSPVEPFLRPGDNKEDVEPEEISSEQRRARERHVLTRHEVQSRPVEITELLRERRAVVLGDPGAGKTTLLRYVAYQLANAQISGKDPEFAEQAPHLANCLPVYVRIGLYAQHLEQSPEATIAEYAPLGCQLFQLPLTTELLNPEMEQGRVLFLLDGLDEIIDTTWRREVAQRVEAFARSWPQCPVVVTSRIVGYREAQLSEQFTQFTISPFAEQEILRFAESWYRALGEPGRAAALVDGILASDSIRRLASNPLLLTVIALIHFRRTKLPHQRVKLYQLAAETLVDQWMSERRVIPEEWDVPETLDVLLPAIAWHLHRTTSSGLINEQDLHDLLVKTMRQHEPRLSEQDAHRRAAQFRRNVAEFSGIFLERGLDKERRSLYGFLHLTFEEYFAAVRLGELWDREGSQVLKPLLHDPRWVEIILLAAGRFGEFSQYQATRFVRAILEAGSQYEDILHRDLLLAARCLGDDVRVDADLRRTIFTQLLELYFNSQSPSALCEDIGKAFDRLSSTAARADLLETLMKKLSATDGSMRWAAARALGRLGPAATPEVLAALLKRLSDTDGSVREAAADALRRLGPAAATPEVLAALLQRLSDTDRYVRWAAADALRRLGPAAATPEVLAALLQRLSDTEGLVREAAAHAVGNLSAYVRSQARSQIVKSLLPLASNKEDREKCNAGYIALRNLLAAEASD